MKKLLSAFVLSILSIVLFNACTEDNDEKFGGDTQSGWVQFKDGNAIDLVYTQGAVYRIPVSLFSPVNTTGLEVGYSITNIVGTTAGILSFDPVITYEPNTNTGGEVVLEAIAPTLSSNIEFDVTLTSTSRSNVQLGLGLNEKPIKKRVRICATSIASSYTGSSTNTTNNATFSPWSPIITPVVGEPNKYQFDTCWGLGFVQFLSPTAPAGFNYPGFITINSDNTVTVQGINSTQFPNRYPGGSGTFNPCTKEIRYTLNQGLFTNPFQVAVVLTAN
jgi:hypothetical protein